MSTSTERITLTPEQAEQIMAKGKKVHTFRNATGIMVGCDLSRKDYAMTATERKTVFSPCRKYRYTLWREWPTFDMFDGCNDGERGSDRAGQYLMVIGLNPSTADETADDPTIRRCIGLAKDLGFGALCMTNLFAYRATDPEVMKRTLSPVGETIDSNTSWNCRHLRRCAAGAGMILAAWGKHGSHLGRDVQVAEMIPPMKCLGYNADFSPKHPLYCRKDSTLLPWPKP